MPDSSPKPVIVPNRNGKTVSRITVAALQGLARRRGFYYDWDYVCVLADGSLLLSDRADPDDRKPGTLIAVPSKHGDWTFKVESEYFEA